MSDVDVAAEGLGTVGTESQPTANGLEATSTEGVGDSEAAGSSADEPLLYEVRVDGKTEKVTFDELQKGYMRQRDYTQKTQSVATQRQELAQMQQLADALESNPQRTLTLLASSLGVDLGQAKQAFAAAPASDDEDPILRLERGFNTLAQQFQSREEQAAEAKRLDAQRQQATAQINQELADLHAQHGDFPDGELVEYAVAHGLNSLDIAHRAWRYDGIEAKRIAELNAATDAKRRAQVVSGGSNPAAGAVVRGTPGQKMTLRDAYLAAKENPSNE